LSSGWGKGGGVRRGDSSEVADAAQVRMTRMSRHQANKAGCGWRRSPDTGAKSTMKGASALRNEADQDGLRLVSLWKVVATTV
jgi:hypothetical protein